MEKKSLTLLALAMASFTCVHAEEIQQRDIQAENSSLQYFFDASFIYWYGKEDGLDLATSGVLGSVGRSFHGSNGEVLKQSFSYNPGFKISTGFNKDSFGFKAEYTWLQSISKTNKNAPDNISIIEGEGVWSPNDWFLQLSSFNQPPVSTNIHSNLHIGLNLLDLLATHPLYSGKKIGVSGDFGLLVTKIDQRINVYMPGALTTITIPTGRLYIPPKDISSHNHSNSWGIGPKLGLETKFLLGQGIRIEGKCAGSLLYTRYTSVEHSEDLVFEFSPADPLLETATQTSMKVSKSAFGTVRPVLELNLGLGWNKEFSGGKYRLDLSSTYDFSFFWSQNVIREMLDEYNSGIGSSSGDLYFQGLTLTAGFAF